MVKTVAFAVSLVLLTITSTFVVTPAVADEDIAAENAKLTAQLASVKADRDHLRGDCKGLSLFHPREEKNWKPLRQVVTICAADSEELSLFHLREEISWNPPRQAATCCVADFDGL